MRIERLDIKGFGKFNNLKLDFKEGFNVVYGKNESGKTTLQWFIKGMLFGLKGGRSGKDGFLPPSKRFKPWSSKDYSGILEYRLENGQAFRIGRNFGNNSVNIYDSLFNDLTAQFETSRERGALFAEKQLGVNENCFEKTVLIRQMETRIDEDGSKELLNRLTNVMESGFEDISYRKAEEALKEALKTEIGTGKTTTRPLDKINSRIEELTALKNEIIQKRLSLIETEQELRNKKDNRKGLEDKKIFYGKVKDYLLLKKELEQLYKKRTILEESINRLNRVALDKANAQAEMSRINSDKEKLIGYSHFENEDADSIAIDYNSLKQLEDENQAVLVQISHKEDEINSLQSSIRHLGDFDISGSDTETIKLATELESMESDKSRDDYDYINDTIQNLKHSKKKYGLGLFLLAIASAAALTTGLLTGGALIWYIAFGALLISALIFSGLFLKNCKALKEAKSKKKISFIYSRDASEQIERKRKKLNEKLQAVGANNLEEYLQLKSSYDKIIIEIRLLESKLEDLKKTITANNNNISVLKANILKKLESAGMEISERAISGEAINEFRNNIRKYKELEPSLDYAQKKLAAICAEADNVKAVLKPYDIAFDDCSQLEKLLNSIIPEIESLELKSSELIRILEADMGSTVLSEAAISSVKSDIADSNAASSMQSIIDELEEINTNINNISLEIRGLETLLNSTETDTDTQQRIEEEVCELEIKKGQLIDISSSIKTALDVLGEASSEIQKDFVPVLNNKMSKIINRISMGRYLDLRANDHLTLNVIAPETGDVVPASLLSSGTTDQMYLALRLAMADFITAGNEKLPLLLDELFSQFDDTRTEQTLELLEELAEGTQVILFTCKQRELDAAEQQFKSKLNTIILP